MLKRILLTLTLMILASKLLAFDLRDQVAQVMVVHVRGSELNEELKNFFEEVPIGGVILYPWANGLTDKDQTETFCSDVKAYFKEMKKSPPWFFVDEEGGMVTRLEYGYQAPSAKEVGESQNLELASGVATELAEKLKEAHIDVNFAPVIDIPSVEGFAFKSRVFGTDPGKVSAFASAYLEAFKEQDVMGCLKHFPGHGRANLDSHEHLPVLETSYQELWNIDWKPYRELHHKAPFVMTAHLLVPSIDDKPATLSEKMVQGILRDKIHYQGIIITDSLMMKGILSYDKDISSLAFKSFEAGHDMLLFGGAWLNGAEIEYELGLDDLRKIHQDLIDKFSEDQKAKERLNQVYEHILAMKQGS